MASERRFQTSFRTIDKDTPGLVLEDDGTVWLVDPDGDRHQLTGGGGTGLPAWWEVDEGQETVIIRGGLSILTENDVATLDVVNNSDDTTESHVRVAATVDDALRAQLVALTEDQGAPHDTSKVIIQVLTPDGSGFANLECQMTMDGSDPVSSFKINHELISFRGDVDPAAHPVLDPATCTPEDIADALIALGLAVAP